MIGKTSLSVAAVSLSLAFLLAFSVLTTAIMPIRLSDGFTAGFLLSPQIHQDITQEALPFLKRDVLSVIKAGNMNVDDPVFGFYYHPDHHFDNCQFEEATMSINDRYTRLMRIQTEEIWTDEQDQVHVNYPKALVFGGILHTVQDFYSHSNWIELGRTNPQTNLIDDGLREWTVLHPYTLHKNVVVIEGRSHSYEIIQPGSSDPPFAFRYFMSTNFYPALISGISGSNNHCPSNVQVYHNDEGPRGRGLNKDTDSRLGFDQARTMAVSQTRHEWCRLVNLERMTNGQAAVDLLFQKYVNDRQQAENACRIVLPSLPSSSSETLLPMASPRPTVRITWSDPYIHTSPDPATTSTYVKIGFEALSNIANFGISSFTCILDGDVYHPCGSASGNQREQGSFEYPVDINTDPPLSGGAHRFVVRAFDTLGNHASVSVTWDVCTGDNEDEIRLCLFLHQSEILQLEDNRTLTDCIECEEVPLARNWTGRYEDSFLFTADEGPLQSNVTGLGEFSFRILENNVIIGRGYGKIDGFVDYMDSQGCGEYFNGNIEFSVGGKFDPITSKARLIFFNVSDIENAFRCKDTIEVRSTNTGIVGYWLGHQYCGDEFSMSDDNNNNNSSGTNCHTTKFEVGLNEGAKAQANSPIYEGAYSTISFFSSSANVDRDKKE